MHLERKTIDEIRLVLKQLKIRMFFNRISSGQYSHSKISNVEECIQKITFTDNNYVPMSSQLRDVNIFESDDTEHSKENDYVIMR